MVKNIVLRPTDMRTQPAPYHERVKIIAKIYSHLEKFKPNNPVIKKASICWEYEIAKKSQSRQGYMLNSSILLRNITRHKGNLDRYGFPKNGNCASDLSREAVIKSLYQLLLSEDSMGKNGFFTSLYNSDDDLGKDIDLLSCYRCESKFSVENIMEVSKCQYHIQKKKYNRETRIKEFACCGASLESDSIMAAGCTIGVHHVYRLENFNQLASVIPFTSTSSIEGEENVLALDCEMAFTSKGYEMVRLTIVDFWSSKTLYDKIVQPIGEIIDLNTRFSGIHSIDTTTAPTFHESQKDYLTPKMINKNTILIGHGLDNDLEVMRLIHSKIIDTAVLYPAGQFKSSLKNLAFEILSRRIQTGEHDSSEDAIASMDVIKKKLNIPLDKNSW